MFLGTTLFLGVTFLEMGFEQLNHKDISCLQRIVSYITYMVAMSVFINVMGDETPHSYIQSAVLSLVAG